MYQIYDMQCKNNKQNAKLNQYSWSNYNEIASFNEQKAIKHNPRWIVAILKPNIISIQTIWFETYYFENVQMAGTVITVWSTAA